MEQSREELDRINSALQEICIWPGTKEEFEREYGYETEVFDVPGNIKGIVYRDGPFNPLASYSPFFRKNVVEGGVVALVNANLSFDSTSLGGHQRYYFGLPVRKKVTEMS